MTTILFGSSGNIGSYLVNNPNGLKFVTLGRSQEDEKFLDLSNLEGFDCDTLPEADTAILLAGITNIKLCDENRDLARLVNYENTLKLVNCLNEKQTGVIFLSSSCVFSEFTENTDEKAVTEPANYYGELKRMAEEKILQDSLNTVLRVPKVITSDFPLILNWIKSWRSNEIISAFSDVKLAPVSISSLGLCINEIVKNKTPGLVHLSPKASLSYFEFAQRLAAILGFQTKLVRKENARDKNISIFSPRKAHLECALSTSRALNLEEEIRKIADSIE